MQDDRYDAIVIGGGSGGISFARRAAGHGARIALIERDRLGGTCVNRGCVPKKLLWTVARALNDIGGLRGAGLVSGGAPRPDMAAVQRRLRAHIDGIVKSYTETLEQAGVTRIAGSARIDSDGTVRVGDRRLGGERVVLATGGRPARPGFDGDEICETSDDALAWDSVPGRLAIVGAGYIGCEFAAIQTALGAEVTLISDIETVLVEFSPGLQKIAADNLRAQGVALSLGRQPLRAARVEGGIRLDLDDGTSKVVDRVLLATGRDTNLDALGDAGGAVEMTDGGQIAIDGGFATSRAGLFAIGDCADRLPLTPVAVDDGRVLAARLFGDTQPDPVPAERVATAAFLLPPVAETGRRDGVRTAETSAPLEEVMLNTGACDHWAYGTEGGNDDGRLAAVSLAGAGVHEAIALAAQMIATGHPPAAFADALPVHPSLTEGLLTAPRS